MSAFSTDGGVMEVTDLDLEAIFGEDVPCEHQSCTGKPAKWLLTAKPCGHSIKMCPYHKAREIATFKLDAPETYCHVNHDLRVTALEATEL